MLPHDLGNTISFNFAWNSGGGILSDGASPVITGNTIRVNTADGAYGGGIACQPGLYQGFATIRGNLIGNNSCALSGGGISAYQGTTTICENTISENTAGIHGGGIYCNEGRAITSGNLVSDNQAGSVGGGIYTSYGNPGISGNVITGNSASTGGGILSNYNSADISGNVVAGNTGVNGGGGILCGNGSPTITDNTVVANGATSGGGAIAWSGTGTMTVSNTIIYNSNSPVQVYRDLLADNAPVFRYCNVRGYVGVNYLGLADPTGTAGNMSVEPRFVNAAAGDYHLKSQAGHWTSGGWVADTVTSPCIDTGDPASAFANEELPNGGRINMGAYGNTFQASKTVVPRVVSCTPSHVGKPNTVPFTASFNVAMHRASVENNFSISPLKTGSFSWVGRKLTFAPTTPWTAGRWYTVTIKKAARSTRGVRMAADFTWNFKTVAPTPPGLVSGTAIATAAGAQITVSLSAAADVQVRILNMAGREVAVPAAAVPPRGRADPAVEWPKRRRNGGARGAVSGTHRRTR